jgi:predicted DCC family thiol-disulfide oxidoreductase YuxK
MINKQIILFDGVCNFCNFWVNFIIDRDAADSFRFAALQSDKGQELLKKFKLNTGDFDTFILIDDEKFYKKSTAALRISKKLNGAWKIFYSLIIIPKPIRDFVYSLIANNRYKFFGKREVCRVPTEQEKNKFL